MVQSITSCPVMRGQIAYNNTSGSICQLVLQFNYFYYSLNTLTVNFSVGANSQGSSSGGGETHSRSAHVYINGTEVTNPAGEDIFNTSTNFSYTGPLTSLRVILNASGSTFIALGPSRTGDAVASFDDTFNITQINSATNFVFTDLTTSAPLVGGRCLMLPPVASYTNRILFIKNKNVVPGNDLGGGQFRSQAININTYNGETIVDVSSVGIFINDAYGCLALFSDGNSWYVANYYPSNGQPLMPNTGSTIVPTVYANNNTVNTFLTTSSNGRNTGTNSIYLRNPSGSPGISIIKYYGSADGISRTSDNPLLIVPDACLIDNVGGGSFLLYVDNPIKSCGAVFITDGTNWYIAGYYNSTNWNWSTYVPLSGTETQLSQSSQLDIKLKSPTGTMNPAFILPQTVSAYPYLCIIKKQGIPQGANTNYFSYALGTPTSGKFNFNNNNIVYTQPQNNTCLWLVANSNGAGSFTYDPVIGYTA